LKQNIRNNIPGKSVVISIWLVLLIGVAARLWLVENQPLFAIGRAYFDDRLFLTLAKNILEGKWLGSYNSMTLVKGPFFSFWVAMTNLVHLPLLLSAQVLYSLSCLLLAYSVKPLVNNKFMIVLMFFVLLFNPASFDAGLTRATREMLYPSLTIIIIACVFGILFSTDWNAQTAGWGTGLGISLGCFWLTREEGIWILPFLAIIFMAKLSLTIFHDRSLDSIAKFIKPWLISFMGFTLILTVVNILNYFNYGIYAKTEMDARSFKSAYGALLRVTPKEVKRYVPVTEWTRRNIYKISPAFMELADYFEGPIGQVWIEQGNGAGRNPSNRTEILGGWFMWAFRDAVAHAGYYNSGKYPDEYYRRLAGEINHACDTGQLECSSERTSLFPVWHWYYIKYLMPSMTGRILALVNFEGISAEAVTSIGSPEELAFFQQLTNEEILSPNASSNGSIRTTSTQWDKHKTSILNAILFLYKKLFPILAVYAAVAFIPLLIFWAKKREGFVQAAVLISIIILIITRVILLSLLDIISYQLALTSYLYPLYPLSILFVLLVTAESFKLFQAIYINHPQGVFIKKK
jgi:hypothetical protein